MEIPQPTCQVCSKYALIVNRSWLLCSDSVKKYAQSFELFLDLTLAFFLGMCTFVSHRMILEKMEANKAAAGGTDKKTDETIGWGDTIEDDDAPEAVPLEAEDEPTVVKAAASSRTRARRKMA